MKAKQTVTGHAPATKHDMELSITARTGRNYLSLLRKHLPAARKLIKSRLGELSIALVGDATMSRLHLQFMDIAGTTDVLTFPLDSDDAGRVVAGEVVICVPEAKRQAKRHKIPAGNEIVLYAIHGMLHLSGYDDLRSADYQRMHRMEDRIMIRLGIGATFRPARGGPVD